MTSTTICCRATSLHFCVGDVSGKGVPASLFMAQGVRLFRTLAAEGLSPADIAFRMNKGLAENNKRMMFVTMFIGLLHLDTGQLDFCNCGHNLPVLGGQFLTMQYVNHPLGLWGGTPSMGGRQRHPRPTSLLIYTGRSERGREQAGGAVRQRPSVGTDGRRAEPILARGDRPTEDGRRAAPQAGAEPNDDLTLMCIKYIK